MPAKELYVGLMSGTSMDSIDAALVELGEAKPRLIDCLQTPYPQTLRAQLMSLCQPGGNEIDRLGELDIQVAEAFAQATLTLLEKSGVNPNQIHAIGSHGQTLRHRPGFRHPFSLQIGDPNTLAYRTGITTVADFRRADLAAGGQGAPLVPAFHQEVFRNHKINRVILNIGGIANLTWLPADPEIQVIGFDTGPGNTLLDHWNHRHRQTGYDKGGAWGASGKTLPALLEQLLSDPYFELPHPKSTGTDHFNLAWLQPFIDGSPEQPADIQATLVELTVESVARSVENHCPQAGQLLVCGGGVHNRHLMQRLASRLPGLAVTSTATYGVDPDWVEAMTFAWLAQRRLQGLPGNLPSVTGAGSPMRLGGLYHPNSE
jgi:anhydro-N-acetylmuramic acid kinase